MTYAQATHFAQTWGLGLLTVLFVIVLIYALWPKNAEKFKRAARMPLNDGDDNGQS